MNDDKKFQSKLAASFQVVLGNDQNNLSYQSKNCRN